MNAQKSTNMIAEKIKHALENMHRMSAEELSEYDAFLQLHSDKPLSEYSSEDRLAMQQFMPTLIMLLQKRVKELRGKVEQLNNKTDRRAA